MNQFQYILKGRAGFTYYIPDDPMGIEDATVVWKRSRKYWGMFPEVVMTLTFRHLAAYYIRQEYYTYFLDGQTELQIQKLNYKSDLTYFNIFPSTSRRFSFDWTTFEDGDDAVTIGLKSIGWSTFFAQSSGTDFRMPGRSHFPYSQNFYAYPDVTHAITGVTPLLLWQQIADYMSNDAVWENNNALVRATSTFLATLDNDFIFVNGRAFTWFNGTPQAHAGGILTMSMDAFFDTINSFTPVGMGVELVYDSGLYWETLVFEQRSYFFQKSNIVSLTAASNFKLSTYNDLIFNRVKLGFPEVSYKDEFTSRFEVNQWSRFGYKFNNILQPRELDLTAKCRADWKGIYELITGDNSSAFSDDSSFQNYIVKVEDRVVSGTTYKCIEEYQLHNTDPNLGIYGVTDTETVYNLYFTPQRSLQRHIAFMSDLFPGFTGKSLEFLAGSKYQNYMESAKVGLPYLPETDPVTILAASILYPILIEWEVPYDVDMIDKINMKPHGTLDIDYKGQVFTVYLDNIEIKAPFKGSVSYRLIPTNDNNLTTMIR